MTYRIDGMTCGGCVRSVKQALQDALPALSIEVDLQTNTIQVEGVHTEEQLRHIIEEAGFDWVGVPAEKRR